MESNSLLLSEHLYRHTDRCSDKIRVQPAAGDTSRKIQKPNPDSMKSRFKQLFCFHQDECKGVPLVCWGRLEKDDLPICR